MLWGSYATTKGVWCLTFAFMFILLDCVGLIFFSETASKLVIVASTVAPIITHRLMMATLRTEFRLRNHRMDEAVQTFFKNAH